MAKNLNPSFVVYVALGAPYAAIKYGFLSRLAETSRELFGQKAVTASDLEGFVFKANAPKPGRAHKKVVGEGSTSGYYDVGQAAALRAEGYSLGFPKFRISGSSLLSIPHYVELNGVKYAWNVPNGADEPQDLEGIGALPATKGEQDLVFGASFPKPPKASITVNTHTFSTFYNPTAELPANWSAHAGKARYTAAHFAAYISG